MKTLIRVLLIAASACMVWGNWHNGPAPLTASVLFLTANALALVVNLKPRR